MKLTVAIPTHEMEGRKLFLERCLDSLWSQTFQDFDIVVTDNSDDDVIKDICTYYGGWINYFRNPIKGMAQNTNEAIKRSTGSWIKILYLDDYMAHAGALQKIWDNPKGNWLVTGCEHTFDGVKRINTHRPEYTEKITTNNTIGSPSVLTIKNEDPLLFDEKMQWLLDADYYKRCYDRWGAPTILKDINVVIGLGEHQLTNTMGDEIKSQELDYIIHKHV